MKSGIFKITIIFFMLLTNSIIPFTTALNIEKNNLAYEYYTYQQMTDLLQDLQSQNPGIMKLESYGKTYEGRDVWVVKLSDYVEVDEDEPGVLLLGAHHGDEKMSFELLIFFIKYMVENYSIENTDNDNDGSINEDPIDGKDNDQDGEKDEDPSEDRVREAIDNTQIFIIPMINPDGVEANTRKNCNPDSEHGVNTNRNFGYDWIYYDLFPTLFFKEWAIQETSGNYRGPSPYSEVETQAVVRVAESYTLNLSLSYHSGATVVFYPWYHTTADAPHEKLFIEIGEEMGEISGYPLWTGSNPPFPTLGGTLGTSENYLYGEHKVIAYTVESHRQKAPTNPTSVYDTCVKNVGVHLYLCEKAQTVDNTKPISRNFLRPFPRVLSLLQKIILQLS
jgi:carboxypeptidase T